MNRSKPVYLGMMNGHFLVMAEANEKTNCNMRQMDWKINGKRDVISTYRL